MSDSLSPANEGKQGQHGLAPSTGTVPMKLKKILAIGDAKCSKKRKALKKVLRKLQKKRDKIEAELKAKRPGRKVMKLKTQLKANKRHRTKAKKLIAELE
jgi:hypothetical protein